jgi:hypothetical protein
MRHNSKWIAGFVLGLLFLAGARSADAHSWCKTRSGCHWWAKRYTANARTGCFPSLIPFCWHHSGSCGSASTSCGHSCLPGGASASATNNSSGCFLSSGHTGLGWAADLQSAEPMRDDDQGGGRIVSTSEFDARGKTVAINLVEGEISSLAGGMPQRIEVYVFRDDSTEETPVEEPVRTKENTLWQGYVELRDGRLSSSGIDTRSFRVSTDSSGLSTASFANVRTQVSLAVSDVDVERLVVEVASTETNEPPTQ